MKKSELRQIIQEELENLNEGAYKNISNKDLFNMFLSQVTLIKKQKGFVKTKPNDWDKLIELTKELKKR